MILAPNTQLAIIWTNDGITAWRGYVSIDLGELRAHSCRQLDTQV